MKNLFTSLFTLVIGLSFSQYLPNYYTYFQNEFNVNPGYTGFDDNFAAVLNSRNQASDLTGASKNIMLGFHTPMTKYQSIGGSVISDTRGLIRTSSVDVKLSHRVNLATDHRLIFGLSVGMMNRQIHGLESNLGENDYTDLSDPKLKDANFNRSSFMSGFGLLYNWKDLELGISSPQLVVASYPVSEYFVGKLAYTFHLNENWIVRPYAVYQHIPVTKDVIDVNASVQWKNMLMVEAGFRTLASNVLLARAGYLFNGIGIYYGFERNFGSLTELNQGYHQVTLTININKVHNEKAEENRVVKKLDNFIDHFDDILGDMDHDYSKEFILADIQRIKDELQLLLESNHIHNVDIVDKKITIIEEQIQTLLSKYKQK